MTQHEVSLSLIQSCWRNFLTTHFPYFSSSPLTPTSSCPSSSSSPLILTSCLSSSSRWIHHCHDDQEQLQQHQALLQLQLPVPHLTHGSHLPCQELLQLPSPCHQEPLRQAQHQQPWQVPPCPFLLNLTVSVSALSTRIWI